MRDGASVQLWLDLWVPNYLNLQDFAMLELSNEEKEAVVRDYVTPLGSWDIQLFVDKLSKEFYNAVLTMNPPVINAGPDLIAWDLNADGSFTIKSAYNGLSLELDHVDSLD